jgi:hypothetical protein
VRGEGPGARDLRDPWRRDHRPAIDVDDVGELPLAIDQEECPLAVAEPVDALEAGQLDAVVQGVGRRGAGRVVQVVAWAE